MKQRFEKLRYLLSKEISVYPILTGILFVTTELHKNWIISTSINKILFALIVIIFCLATIFLTRLLIKNKTKASLIAALFIGFNLYYQYLFSSINDLGLTKLFLESINTIHAGRYIGSFLAMICFGLTILIIKTQKNLFSLNLYLNIVISSFLIFEVGTIIFTKPFTVELIHSPDQHTGKLVNSIIKDKPNIYFILLDSYTSSESLKKYWGYDNTPFEDSLAKIGFFVTHSSKSDYDYTPYCMASYLNMSLLKLNNKRPKSELYLQPLENTSDLIQKSCVIRQIVNSGYTFINYSIFNISYTSKLYDTEVSGDWKKPLNAFFFTTIWIPIISKIQSLIYPNLEVPAVFPNLKTFQLLQESIDNKSNDPKFVYAHIMMPHPPFEYDENGNRMSYEYRNILNNESYLKQLRFTNTKVIETIQKILATEKKKPIIIIQGDHGYRLLKDVDSEIQRTEAHSIFSSYLFPYDLKVQLNDSIKPIQAFSLFFNMN